MPIEYLLDEKHRSYLAHWVGKRPTLYAFDFDGTLCPAVTDPNAACMGSETREALVALTLLAKVAVVSERARPDLLRRIPSNVPHVIGNHGNDGLPQESALGDEHSTLCNHWLVQLQEEARNWQGAHGAWLENRGASLSLHYRGSSNPDLMRARMLARVARLEPPPMIIRGDGVIDLLPPQARTKRDAIMIMLKECACDRLFFVGNDYADETVFQDAPNDWLTVRVEPGVHTEARYHLRGVHEVPMLLQLLVAMQPG